MIKPMEYPNSLSEAIDVASNRLVSCNGCTKCCEKGIAYVLPEEVEALQSRGVSLVEIDGVNFIMRNGDGSCSMLNRKESKCSIYEHRPMCCRAFPLDVFSRHGKLEWAIYTYCPPDRVIPIIEKDGGVSVDLEVASYLAASIEKKLTEDVIKFLAKEDGVAAQIEILDEHRNDFAILGPLLRKENS